MLLGLLRQYLRPYTAALLAIVGLQVVATIASLYLPSLNADIIDRGVSVGDTGYILKLGGVMLAISVAQIGCTLAAVRIGARTSMRYGRDLRAAVFHRVGEFSAQEVARFGAPSLITRTTNDVQQLQVLVLMSCTMLVTAPIMSVGGIVMALREDASLSRLLLVAVPLLAGSIGLVIARMVPQFRAMQPRIDKVNGVLREQITGVRVVRAFVRDDAEAARFDLANADLTATALHVGRLQALIFPTVMFIFNMSTVAVLWFGAHRAAEGSMEVGALIAFLSYLMQILMAVMIATFMAMMIPRAAVCAERIREVLDLAPSVVGPVTPVTPTGVPGTLEFTDVEFRYPGAQGAVLEAITFTARPGQVTAIIGGTGAGKSTLLELIPRLIDPTSGTVRIEGTDLRQLALEALWARIGMVPQRPYLFSGTIATNLRYGKPDATDAELWAALEVAQADDFVKAMPLQLDAPIGQGGTNVSGGQRQRLSIARALLRQPSIFLFDDSFSALDLATEARLRVALRPHTQHAAVIVVAQRIASIRDADQIIVLDAGRIVGCGTHAELTASCATYQEIVTSQQQLEVAA